MDDEMNNRIKSTVRRCGLFTDGSTTVKLYIYSNCVRGQHGKVGRRIYIKRKKINSVDRRGGVYIRRDKKSRAVAGEEAYTYDETYIEQR